jgi:hypothetical protein
MPFGSAAGQTGGAEHGGALIVHTPELHVARTRHETRGSSPYEQVRPLGAQLPPLLGGLDGHAVVPLPPSVIVVDASCPPSLALEASSLPPSPTCPLSTLLDPASLPLSLGFAVSPATNASMAVPASVPAFVRSVQPPSATRHEARATEQRKLRIARS